MSSDVSALIAAGLPLVWLGFVLAISFMEAPLKFRAAHASRQAALSIGQLVFRALARVERALLVGLAVALWFAAWPAAAASWFWGMLGVVAIQQAWLLPRLDRRTAAALVGRPLKPEPLLHTLYAVGEGLKLVLLPGLSWSVAQPWLG